MVGIEKYISPEGLIAFYDKFPKTYNIYIIASLTVLSGLMFGFDIASVSAFVGQDRYREYFGYPSSIMQSGITSAMPGGSFVGSLVSPYFSDPLGRRLSMQICAFFWIVGAAIQSSAQNTAQLIIGRFISGFGVGFGTSVAPTYLAETSPKKIKGAIGGCFQFAVTVGILVMFYIGFGCSYINGVASFRVAWGIQIIPGLFMFVGALLIPESPRWLANHGHWDKAEEVIARVQAKGNADDPIIAIELQEIKEQVMIDKDSGAMTYMELFNKHNIKRTFVGISAQVWQQLCGMNVMMYYIVYVFQMAGYSGNANLVSSSIQYVLNTVMTIPALFLIDKVGRRPVLLVGGVLMMTWLFAEAGILAVYSNPLPNVGPNDTITIEIPKNAMPAAHGLIACSYLFVCSFAPTWGVGIWLYAAEIFPNRQRAKATAVTTSANWIFNWALAMFVPTAFRNISWKTYIIFAVFCVVLTIQTYFMFPETKGKTLEEIDMMWQENIPAWKSANYVPELPVTSDKVEKPTHTEDASSAGSDLLNKTTPEA